MRKEQADSGWRLLRQRDIAFLWWGQVISQVGDSLNKVALLWFVYELTGSALKMTLIGLLQTLPPLVFGPLIGVYLDRLPKKQVMIWVDVIRAVMVALIPVLFALEALTLERLYVLVFLTAIVSTIFGPALSSAVPLVVSKAHLTAANALLQSTCNIGLLVGPAISGTGIAFIGVHNVLYINAVSFLISALFLLPIRVPEAVSEYRSLTDVRGLAQDLLTGFRFVFSQDRTVALLMATAALYSLGMSAFMFLLPVIAKNLLHLGPVELGWLWSALGCGMLAASTWLSLSIHRDQQGRLRIVSGSVAVGGLAVGGLGLLEIPGLAIVLILVIGGSTALFTPVVWGLLQEMTPHRLLGRVFTAFSIGGMSAAMAGMAGFGWAADAMGLTVSLVGISLVLLGTAAVMIQISRRQVMGVQVGASVC